MGFFSRLLGREQPKHNAASGGPATSESFLFTLASRVQGKEAMSGYDSLGPDEQLFFCVWTVEAEVNNGGLDQFYSNNSGDIACFAPEAFRAIGAQRAAALIEEANGMFGDAGPPTDTVARQERLATFGDRDMERLEGLDSAFLEYPDDLSQLLAAYMQAHGYEG
jgi:hypothetical protein